MDDIAVSLDDYRELAAYLEERIAEAEGSAPHEVEELCARVRRLREILAEAAAGGGDARPVLAQDRLEPEAFELKTPQARPDVPPDVAGEASAPPPEELAEIEALVAQSPGDDALRRRYVEAAEACSCQPRAAEVLRRALDAAARPDVRERLAFDVALLFLGEGELAEARRALLDAVAAGAGGPARLAAARRLLELQGDPGDPDQVGPACEAIAKSDPDPAARRRAAEALLSLHARAPQPEGRLAAAHRAMVGSPRTAEALAWLRHFYAKRGDATGLLDWLEHAEHWGELAAAIEGDVNLVPAKEKGRLYARLGEIRLAHLDDVAGARTAFARALAIDPAGAAEAALGAVARAGAKLRDRDRHDLTLKAARVLSHDGKGARALEACRALFAEESLDAAAVQELAEIARDEDDAELYPRALDRLSRVGDAETKKKALERLGDFQFAQLGDRRAAAESWRPAALMYEGAPGEKEQARALYERVLEAVPSDRAAAARLAEIYAEPPDWAKLPGVLRVLVRSSDDWERGAGLLLRLEKSAVEAGEAAEYAALVEELAGRAPPEGRAPERRLALKRARARVLGADPARHADASAAYREVVEASQSEDDVRAFEAFLDAGPSAQERHRERRWLYERRVSRGPRPAEALLEWAKAEEDLGETEAAIALYVRLSELAPSQREGLTALCRLKLHAGDFEGGLAALRALRDGAAEDERRAVTLQMARVLLEDLGRPAEAALALAPLLDAVPPLPAARQMMRRALADPAAREQVVDGLEKLVEGGDRAAARRALTFLVDATEGAAPGARRRWFERLVEISGADAKAALSAATRGAVDAPDATSLWDHAERAARELRQPEPVIKAYRDALVERVSDAALAEALARRMTAFASGSSAADPGRVVEALLRLLELAPAARWALDRVKLALASAARWDDLFRVYDRAIEAATGADRADLLDEAARAAGDAAGQPDRAIPYLEAIHGLRPDDERVGAALERAYERQGKTRALIDLVSARLERAAGFKRREGLQRLASLWLDVGGVAEASGVVDTTLSEGADVADVAGLLERVVAAPAGEDGAAGASIAELRLRAAATLREHYERRGKAEDVVRMAAAQLALAEGAPARAGAIRDLGALLSRGTKLALEKARRRELLREIALDHAERTGEREHAVALLSLLFEEDAGDDAAARSVAAYAALLEGVGQRAGLAALWEGQARARAAEGKAAEERACWERAGDVWRDQGSPAEAEAAYERAAALDSETAYERLASLREERGDSVRAAAALEWLYARAPAQARGRRALRLAAAYVAHGDRGRARARLEGALAAGVEADRVDEASDTLIDLYRSDGAWKALADWLAAKAGRTRDADAKLALLREAAELLRAKAAAPAEAAALLEKAVHLRPADPALRPALADVLEAIGRWDRAAEVLKDHLALPAVHLPEERGLAHQRRARAMTRAGQAKEALAELRAAAEALPAHPGVLHDLARAALEAGQLDVAEGTYRALLLALHHPGRREGGGAPEPPRRADVFLDLGEIAARKGDAARAADLVDSAVDVVLEAGEADPERVDAVLAARGRLDLLARAVERRVERAATLAARAAALASLARAWSEHLGRAQDGRERIARHAERIGRELEHEAAADVGAWSALVSVYGALGDEGARAATARRLTALLEAAIAQAEPGPARATLRVTFSKALLRAGNAGPAIHALTSALDEDPDAAEAAALLAAALSGAGRAGEARGVLERWLSRRPGDAAALGELASIAAAQGDWEAAADAYRGLFAAARGAEQLARYAAALADACEKAGRPDDARDALERALGEAPESAPLVQRLARICEKNGDFARLARLAETLRAKSPESPEAVLLWAHALHGLGRSSETLAALTAAIERCRGKRAPVTARLLFEAARAHLAGDDLLEAFEQLKAAFAIDPRNADTAMLLALVAVDVDDERTAERAFFAVTSAQPKGEAERRAQAAAFYHLAAMAEAKGDGGKGRRLLGKALALEPGLAPARRLLEQLDRAGSAVVARSAVASQAPAAPGRSSVTPRS